MTKKSTKMFSNGLSGSDLWNFLKILETFAAICEKDSLRKQSHFESAPMVSPGNDVWATTVEIPYWWRVTTQIWVVHLIGWSKFPNNQKHSSDLSSERHQHGISAVDLQTSFSEETSCVVAKCWLLRSQIMRKMTYFSFLLLRFCHLLFGWCHCTSRGCYSFLCNVSTSDLLCFSGWK